MMKQMNKKGAIEITATAIVVFIIAIVVLGAVIYFIQSFFPDVFGIVKSQLTQIKQTLRTQLPPGEKVAFNFGNELTMKSGETENVYMGIKNDYSNTNPDKDHVCFKVAFTCIRAFNTAPANCNGDTSSIVGGIDNAGNKASDANKWFGAENLLAAWDIKNNDFDAQGPISLQPTVPSDIYSIRADVYKTENNGDCLSGEAFKKYRSKEFRLIVQ